MVHYLVPVRSKNKLPKSINKKNKRKELKEEPPKESNITEDSLI
jgi:hypothetical protein